MNYKTLSILFWIFTLLPLLIAIILLFFLPETIPIHWTDPSQEPDGYGSKYIILLLPVVFFVIFFVLKQILRLYEEMDWKEKPENVIAFIQFLLLLISFCMFCVNLQFYWSVVSISLFS
jgi:Protein of unknown function (DUF1648).